ncbi:glyoxalase III HchA [Acinetobacter nematophilus]|uniref:Protein deglycase HchA n=1 Tax=Acinetobacter nematophilus TaxID=2994642 RepID=A0A9X3E1W7_9GAMM|nr:glyoxalase III HchA [Acinetobacter nematophilus]MCX5468509.1 protein deglycase HchA [Acinetobacter nematophilus]
MIKSLFGLSPQLTDDGSYSPSLLSLKMATSKITDYTPLKYEKPNDDKSLKILVLCTEQNHMPMKNGKLFSTGNHPVEMMVPMLHFKNAGFDFDIFTPTGKPVKIEMWAMPTEDENVISIYETYKDQFSNPKSLADFASAEFFDDESNYIAIFIPGGHGAMLGLPEDKNVGHLLKWAHNNDLFNLIICHGPAALLAAKPENGKDTFIFDGYKIAAFPDSMDKFTPLIGYMPGKLTWFYGEKLKKLGVKFVNSKADGTCFIDRKLITGASPKAANEFGKLGATKLLESLEIK